MAWTGLNLTAEGRIVLNKAQLNNKLNFKSIVVGDGNAPPNLSTQKQLVHQLYELRDLKIDINENECTLTADLPIVDYDYYLREIGIIVTTDSGDKLYAYDNCGDDAQYIVTTTGVERTEKRIRLALVVSGVDNITVSTPSVLYVDYKDYEETVTELKQTKVDIVGGNISNTIINFKQADTIENIQTGEKASLILGKISKAIDELMSHLTDKVKHITSDERTLWNTVKNKVDSIPGKGLSANDYTTLEKSKLSGIAEKANNYLHPASHPANMIEQDATHRFVSDNEKTSWNDANSKKHTHSNKSVLDGITSALIASWNKITDKLDKTGDASNTTTSFSTASTRSNISTGEKLAISLGKIAKWFSDLKNVAFTGSYNDLSDRPTVGNGTITIKQAGTNKGTFSMNQTGNTTIELSDNNTWRPVETLLTNQNLDAVVTPGFYNAGGGNTCANKPSGIDAFGLIVTHNAGGQYYTQMLFNNTGAISCRRYCISGTWGNWLEDKFTDTTYSNATTSTAGLMSPDDKTTLNNLKIGAVTGVKGSSESTYRTGNVNLTPANIGALATTGGTLTGGLKISNPSYTNGYINMFANNEGGNIQIQAPNGKVYEIDSYNSDVLRIYAQDDSGNNKFAYFNRKTGALSADGGFAGNAASASKLATARNINGIKFDGTSDIQLPLYFSYSFGVTQNVTYYSSFCRMNKTNKESECETTVLVTATGNFGGTTAGTYLISMSNRGQKATMTVVCLQKNTQSDLTFGYYSDNTYFYFGAIRTPYSYSTNLTVLSKSASAETGKFLNSTTKPTNWVDVAIANSIGGNASTVNGHTVNADVPANAKFTDNNTTYGAGTGIGLSNTTFYNTGVRGVATGSTNGTLAINTNGTVADVKVKGLNTLAYASGTWNKITGTNCTLWYNEIAVYLEIAAQNVNLTEYGSSAANKTVVVLPTNVMPTKGAFLGVISALNSAWVPLNKAVMCNLTYNSRNLTLRPAEALSNVVLNLTAMFPRSLFTIN